MRPAYAFVIIFLVTMCGRDDDFKPVVRIEEQFQPIVDEFMLEAEKRGFEIELTNLIIEFDPGLGGVHCGKCNSASMSNDIQKVISIRSDACWSNSYEFEALVLHEIGHCVLGREHDEAKLPSGDAKSIMAPSDISMYSVCIYDIDPGNCDKTYRRTYYLNELFNPSEPVPDWGQ